MAGGDGEGAATERKCVLRREVGAFVEGVGEAKEGDENAEGGDVVDGMVEDLFAALSGDFATMVEGEKGEVATLVGGDREGGVGEEHLGAVGGMIGVTERAADIMGEGGEREELAVGGGEVVEGLGEVEEFFGEVGDAEFVVDIFGWAELAAHPVTDGGLLGGGYLGREFGHNNSANYAVMLGQISASHE